MPEADGATSVRWLVFLVLAALVARLAAWAWFEGIEPSIWDEQEYDALAVSLVERGELALEPGRPTAQRPPLYPVMVALVYAVAGVRDYQAVRLVQVLLNVALVPVVFAIGRRLWDARTGLWAAALAAFYPSLWGHDYLILTEVLFTLLLCSGALLLVRFFDQEQWTALASGAAILGLATLTRSSLQVYPPLFALVVLTLWRRPAARRWAALGVFLAFYALPVAPWMARNSVLHGRPTPVDTTGPRLLEQSTGLSLGTRGWSGSARASDRGARDFLARTIDHALRFWRIDRELVGAAARGWLGPIPKAGVVLLALALGGYYVVLLLAGLFGMLLHPPRALHLAVILSFVLALLGVHALVFGHSRYHIPLMPLVALFGGRLLVAGPVRRAAFWRLATAAALALVLVGSWGVSFVRQDLPELRRGLEGTLHELPRYRG